MITGRCVASAIPSARNDAERSSSTTCTRTRSSPGIADATERAARQEADEQLAREVETVGVESFVDRWLAQPMWATVPLDAPGLSDRRTLTSEFLAHCLRVLGTGTMEPLWDRLG